jgi:hypothetical protein
MGKIEYIMRYNKENYKQVKVYMRQGLAAELKAYCAARGESVANVIISEICALIGADRPESPPARKIEAKKSTLNARRKETGRIISALERIKSAEEEYRDGIPGSMENKREAADNAVSAIEEAIEKLKEAYNSGL